MSIWDALLWVGELVLLVVVARAMGYRSRKDSYRFGAAVAGGIFLLGAMSRVWGSFVAVGVLAALASSAVIFLARRGRGLRRGRGDDG
jgi:hypothetical protein